MLLLALMFVCAAHLSAQLAVTGNTDNLVAPVNVCQDGDIPKKVSGEWTCVSAPTTFLDDLADVEAPSPATNQVLKWSGSAWAPGTDVGGTGSDEYCSQANVRCAHLFSGADAGAQIAAAIANCPARGCTVDARGVTNTTLSAFTVTAGATVVLPSVEYTQTGTVTVNEGSTLLGTTDGRLGGGTRFNLQSGPARSIYLLPSAGRVSTEWCHKCKVANILISCDGCSAGSDGVEAYQLGENATVEYIQTRNMPGCGFLIGASGEAPNSQAGANWLRQIEPNGSGDAGVCLTNMAGEFYVHGLSGDCNDKMFRIDQHDFNALSLVVDNTKSESPSGNCPGTNDPWMLIDNFDSDNSNNPVTVITVLGGRHTQNSGGATDWIKIQNMTAGAGVMVHVINEFLQGYTNFINDVPNGQIVTVSSVTQNRNSKILSYVWDGVNSDAEVVQQIGRGLWRPMANGEPVQDCNPGRYGALFFDPTEKALCVCTNDGTDDAYLRSDDYSHAAGHCSVQ